MKLPNRLDRREFLKSTGATVISLACGGAGPESQPAEPQAHRRLIPEDKGLPADSLRHMTERGEPAIVRGRDLETIGMPVGGIAAGQLYLRGDGMLGCWQIFNGNYFSGFGSTNYRRHEITAPLDSGLFVVVLRDGKPVARELGRRDFADVRFVGEYPIARITYQDPGCPLRIELEAFSPFIPLNAAESALPATLLSVTLTNTSGSDVACGLLAGLQNGVCFHTAGEMRGLRVTRVARADGQVTLVHSAMEIPGTPQPLTRATIVLADFEAPDYAGWQTTGAAFGTGPAHGTLPTQQAVTGFSGGGLVNSFLDGDESQGTLQSPEFPITRRFINFLVGGGAHRNQTCVNLLIDGQVVRSTTGKNNERLAWASWNVSEFEGRPARIQIVDHHAGAWGHINVDQIELSDERREGPSGPINKLFDFGNMALAILDGSASPANLPDALTRFSLQTEGSYPLAEVKRSAIASGTLTLKPGAARTLRAALAWYFPNSAHGQQYANRFTDSEHVIRHLSQHHTQLAGDTRTWHETFYDSTLPRWLLDRIGATFSALATGTCQWWKDGRFWAWEGVGCCAGTCTHVWNYAHAMAWLFPELERSAREMQDLGEGFHPTGLVGFRGAHDRTYAADGQCGTVLKCYREHLMSADDAFLKRNWPKIKLVVKYLLAQDRDDDGLLEGSQPNTYDIAFEGPNTFVGALYLAALRAGEEMAREMNDTDFATRLRHIFESGQRLSAEKLWNGEYFVQRTDLDVYPRDQYGDGCLSDQLFGQCWAHQVGLGHLYAPDMIRTALQSIWKYNWAPDIGPYNAAYKPERWFAGPGEAGLFVCTWPRSKHLDQGVRYRDEVWTGIEYQVASHMIWEGMITEGLAMVRAIHDRYQPSRRNPFNEVECGDHYARAMASYGVLTALCGFEYHGPRGHLGFSPRLTPEDFRAPFTAAEGWGTLDQQRDGLVQHNRVTLRHGRLRLQSLTVTPPRQASGGIALALHNRAIVTKNERAGDRLTVTFDPVAINAGQTLELTCS